MEPSEELRDDELNAALQRWHVPPMPPHVRREVFPEPTLPWWKRAWSVSIRVPAPLAVALLLLLSGAAWRGAFPSAPKVEAPAAQEKAIPQMAAREPAPQSPSPASSSQPKHASHWRLVTDLRPRIIPASAADNANDKN